MDKVYDMIIIGGGPAGYTAALYASRAGLRVLILERMSPGGQMTLTGNIDNYPGFENGVDGFELGMKMQTGAHRFGAETEYAEVIFCDFSHEIKRIETTVGSKYARTVVIATGADPKKLGIQKEEELTGRGVHYCAHCDGRFYKDKTVIVVGGGNSAAADALYLSKLVKKVYLVHRRDSLRAEKIYHEPLKNAENIEFLWDSKLEKIMADGKIKGAVVKDIKSSEIKELDVDGIFISIGRKPVTDFLSGSVSLNDAGYIIADESTKTNISGVFAAGDVRTKALRQVITAAADGAVAAHFAEEYIMANKA